MYSVYVRIYREIIIYGEVVEMERDRESERVRERVSLTQQC